MAVGTDISALGKLRGRIFSGSFSRCASCLAVTLPQASEPMVDVAEISHSLATPRLTVTEDVAGPQTGTSGITPDSKCFQQWNADSGDPSALFYRVPDGYLIRFPAIADFHVSPKGDHVRCSPVVGSGDHWQPIYQQQVLPLLHSLTGDPVYHGAAVVVDGVAIAFLGPSGWGKSTLAAAFAMRGHPFLGDDCLQLTDSADGRVHVRPHANYIRLWDDSMDALASPELPVARMPGSPKPHLSAADDMRHSSKVLPLARMYVLGDGSATLPTLASLTAAEMLLAWTRNAFILDIKSPAVLRRSFEAASRLAKCIPARQLDYPRRYESLDDVLACVQSDLKSA